jgi:hypothetical protein
MVNQIDPIIRRRLRQGSAIYVVLWGLGLALIFLNAPYWSVVLVGVAATYFAVRDWRTVVPLAREAIFPAHRDPDVQALIDGNIDISEYRQRKEKGDAV